MEASHVSFTFESVNEILWCDHSNETSAVLSLGAICFPISWKMKFGIFLDFGFYTLLGVNDGRMQENVARTPQSLQCLESFHINNLCDVCNTKETGSTFGCREQSM